MSTFEPAKCWLNISSFGPQLFQYQPHGLPAVGAAV